MQYAYPKFDPSWAWLSKSVDDDKAGDSSCKQRGFGRSFIQIFLENRRGT